MIAIIIPTYNERENLGVLVRKIIELRISDAKLFVVDDDSPDGTGQYAEELSKSYPIKVIHRKAKDGLGRAYSEAFKYVLTEKPDLIVHMDADLSHDPAVIPFMLQRAAGTCDVVLGARYTEGGKIENWNWMRRFVSYFGNLYARTILGVPYRDLTSGFKCWRRETLEAITVEPLDAMGYVSQIEATYRAHKKGFRICEVPITFTERKEGKSKFNLWIFIEAFWRVLLLRFRK